MSLLRRDPLSHGWVIFTPLESGGGVRSVEPTPVPDAPEDCPFCAGREAMTPPEIAAYRHANTGKDGPGWTVRTVPNRDAMLHIEGRFDRRGEGLYDMMNGIGAHEVIIETPEHGSRFFEFTREKIAEIISMWRDRVADLSKDSRFRAVQVFRNYKAASGAQLVHPNSQVIALPVVPRWVREEINHAMEYWGLKERCIFCDIIAQDAEGPRAVHQNEFFTAICPFASKFPYEVWIYPRDHESQFHRINDMVLPALADILKVVLTAVAAELGDPAYNLVVHNAPVHPEKRYHTTHARLDDYYHWHMEVLPRVGLAGGFEYGTGFYMNPMLPESAAERLRARIK